MTLLPTVVAGIAWDPQIRGILAVLTGIIVLGGGVYLLLATNLATRLGFLVILTALFGWMTIHGMVWWLYPPGQGPIGRIPSWEVEEINHGDLSQALLGDAQDLDTSGLPSTEDLNDATDAQIADVNDQFADQLNEWELLAASDASRAEAQSTADATLAEGVIPGLEESSSYVHLYAFETGGKPERQSDGIWDRVTNRVTNTLRITSPPHYAIVQIQPAIPQEQVVGQAPPPPEADPNAEVISIVMVRDLGQRRLVPALITLGSGLMFGLLCAMLHARDRVVAEHRSAPLPAPTGGGG
ncbi:MAG TPA: hypothetical protein VFG94_13740 [Acidimicrobiales bacterium]|nr:hypothetical protein [Acidimicrobiales bacterium]